MRTPHDEADTRPGRGIVAAALALTFGTGAAGLVYQVVWQRWLTRLAGSDSLATATVLGVFLGGLSVGYLLCGRWTTRSRNLFAAYAALEAAIGVWALAFPVLFRGVDSLLSGWGHESRTLLVAQAFVGALVLVGPPTLCMGGTVPMLTRALASSAGGALRTHASVYAVNTAGACAGILAAGFFLVQRFGLPGTLRGAAALNLAAAAFFLAVGRLGRPGAASPAGEPRRRRAGPPPTRPRIVYAVALVGGFCFMTLEVLLIRVTNLTLGSSSYSFTLVVGAMILCTAAGAAVVAWRRVTRPSALFLNHVAIVVGLAALFPTLDEWPWAAHRMRIAFSGSDTALVLFHAAVFGALVLLLALPAGCMGATLPLAFDRLKRDVRGLGREAGLLFAWNALGSLGGGILGGYLLYRWLGNGEVFCLVLILTAIGAGLTTAWLSGGHRLAATALGALVLAYVAAFPGHEPLRFAAGTFRLRSAVDYSHEGPRTFFREFYRNRNVLAYRDDPDGTFAVVENPSPLEALRELAARVPSLRSTLLESDPDPTRVDPRPRSILVNGKPDSSTFYDRETLRLAAHLPALLAPRRERALVVGLGTGVTAGELTLYPDVESIEVVEISRAVVEFLPLFEGATRGVEHDPRLRIHVGDAFRVLRASSATWDIVTSEPSNPWVAGVDQLFSREFYRTVRARLHDDGVFLQWVQRYATNERILAIAVNTLRAEFPHVRAFRAGHDELLLASTRPVGDEAFARMERALADNPALRLSLSEIGIDGAADLRAREQPELLARAAELTGLGLETLDRPRLHFLAAQAFFRGESLDE